MTTRHPTAAPHVLGSGFSDLRESRNLYCTPHSWSRPVYTHSHKFWICTWVLSKIQNFDKQIQFDSDTKEIAYISRITALIRNPWLYGEMITDQW